MKFIVIALLSMLASILSNQGIAVFNDGLRPLIPENIEGRMDRKSIFITSFALSFGLLIGFGIPFSIGSSIILVHSIFLGTDIIGLAFSNSKKGMFMSGIVGAVYGIALLFGLQLIVDIFSKLPVNFLPNLSLVGSPIIVAFSVFPILVIAYQYGVKKAAISLLIVIITRQVISLYGVFKMNNVDIKLNADGIALLVAIVIMLYFAIRDKKESGNSNEQLLGLFHKRVLRVKKNIIYLALMGGLVSCAVNMGIIAGDLISLNLLKEGKNIEASIVALARTIGFIPLVATTAITTGVYGPTGLTFVFAIGILSKNPIIAFILGFLTLALEIILLEKIAKVIDKFPGIKACADEIRTSMTKVLEVAILVGAMIACNSMVGNNGLGFLFVIGFYLINRASKKPLVDMAVGPISTIIFGILINVLFIMKLYIPIGN